MQDFYDYLSERGLCADSIRRYRAVIRGALDYAYKMEMISDNPANRATIPRDPVARPVGQSYTAEQAAKLLAAIKDEPLYPVVFLTLMLALRREEIAGLKWDAIDLENKRVSICHTRTRLREVLHIYAPHILQNRATGRIERVYVPFGIGVVALHRCGLNFRCMVCQPLFDPIRKEDRFAIADTATVILGYEFGGGLFGFPPVLASGCVYA